MKRPFRPYPLHELGVRPLTTGLIPEPRPEGRLIHLAQPGHQGVAGLGGDGRLAPQPPAPSRYLETINEYSSYGPNSLLAGVGADPWGGTSQSFMSVPPLAITLPGRRYMFRLAAVAIGHRQEAYLDGFRQGLQIGYVQPGPIANETSLVQIEVRTPWWHFPDANVSWHLTFQHGASCVQPTSLVGMPPGMSADVTAIEPALLAAFPPPTAAAYTPPGRGIPPGQPIGSLGNFWDLRIPFASPSVPRSLGLRVVGPGVISMFATIRQTDPTRPGRAAPPAIAGLYLPAEEQFLIDYPNAIYTGIAGSLLVRTTALV